MTHTVREYSKQDVDSIKKCLIDLQDFERIMDPHRLKGIEIAEEYLQHLLHMCEQGKGKVFVVEINEEVVGMISVYIEEDKKKYIKSRTFAYISDLIVLPEYRSRGITKELLEKAQAYAKSKGVHSIQVSLLPGQDETLDVYLRNGFHRFEVRLRKTV